MKVAPVALFVYNRPAHTLRTLEALAENDLARDSLLMVYADGPKDTASEEDRAKIERVREIVESVRWPGKKEVINSPFNKGLARSVIDGVTATVNKYGTVIVLEDDLLTARGFLTYMNEALNRYTDEEKVMQVSGYMFPTSTGAPESSSFFLPMTTSWGWSTWKRAWDHFDVEAMGYDRVKTDKRIAYSFDLNNAYPYSQMLIRQMESNDISSWAIKWWWSVFRKEGLTLFPSRSLVANIGFGKDATHTSDANNVLGLENLDINEKVTLFPDHVLADKMIFDRIRKFLKPHFIKPVHTGRLMTPIAVLKKIYHFLGKKPKSGEDQTQKYCVVGEGSKFRAADQLVVREPVQDKIFLTIGNDCLVEGRFVFENSAGTISVGNRVFIGGGTTFISIDRIEIHDDVMFSWGCTVIDNNAHSLHSAERANDVADWHKGERENKTGFYKNWSVVRSAPVVIKKKAWIGFNVIILKGITIGEGAVVGAGSVVTKDVPDFAVVRGNPAQFIKYTT